MLPSRAEGRSVWILCLRYPAERWWRAGIPVTPTPAPRSPDYDKWLEEVCSRLHPAPHAPTSQYQHNGTGEDACPERSDRKADAHLKRQVMGPEVLVVTNGRLDFGTWERIFYSELDGQRRKRELVKIIGE